MEKFTIAIPTIKRPTLNYLLASLIANSVKSAEIIIRGEIEIDKRLADVLIDYDNQLMLQNVKNEPVAKCRNSLIESSTSDYILYLDDDLILTKGSVDKIKDTANKTNADYIQGALYDLYPRYTDHISEWVNREEYDKSPYRRFSFDEIIDDLEVGNITFAAAKRSSLIEMGGFIPENLPAEDAILFRRMKLENRKIVLRTGALAYHLEPIGSVARWLNEIGKGILRGDFDEWIRKLKRGKDVVYTAHSFATHERASDIAKYVLVKGKIPINPFLSLPSKTLDELTLTGQERHKLDIELLSRSDELWLFGEANSEGVKKEIEWWKRNKGSKIKFIEWEELR